MGSLLMNHLYPMCSCRQRKGCLVCFLHMYSYVYLSNAYQLFIAKVSFIGILNQKTFYSNTISFPFSLIPSSFLSSSRLKIADFGVSTFYSSTDAHNTYVGTPGFMAPELGKEPYGDRVDIYSLGCVCYELCTFKTPSTPYTAIKIRDSFPNCFYPHSFSLSISLSLSLFLPYYST